MISRIISVKKKKKKEQRTTAKLRETRNYLCLARKEKKDFANEMCP